MILFRRIMASLCGAFIALLSITAAALIILMFTDGKENGHHTTLFGAVHFTAYETNRGTTMVGAGVENPLPLAVIFVILFGIMFLFMTFLSKLKQRRDLLLARQHNLNMQHNSYAPNNPGAYDADKPSNSNTQNG